MKNGKLIIISGFPGAGKSHIKEYLVNNIKSIKPAQILTTKTQYENQELDQNIEVVTKEQFTQEFMAGKLCGVSMNDDECLALKTEQIEQLEDGISFVADVPNDCTEGIQEELGDNVISIYILPKDKQRARKELELRFPDPKELRQKLNEIKDEILYYKNNGDIFKLIIKNDYTEKTCEKIKKMIEEKIQNRKKTELDR